MHQLQLLGMEWGAEICTLYSYSYYLKADGLRKPHNVRNLIWIRIHLKHFQQNVDPGTDSEDQNAAFKKVVWNFKFVLKMFF